MFYSKDGIEISSQAVFNQLFSQKTIMESPIRISGVNIINVNSIGAFTFFRGGSIQQLDSIGRFCSVAPNVCIGPTEHDVRLLTTSPFINSWNGNSIADEYWKFNKIERQKALSVMREENARNRKSVTELC